MGINVREESQVFNLISMGWEKDYKDIMRLGRWTLVLLELESSWQNFKEKQR